MGEYVVLAIDDHQLFTSGLERLVTDSFPSIAFVAMPSLGAALDRTDCSPDLIFLDYNLNGISGRLAVAMACQHWPSSRIFVLTSQHLPEVKDELRDHREVKVLSKAMSAEALVEEIRAVLAVRSSAEGLPEAKALSPRQLEVLRQLREGRSNKAIAERMGLSEFTVRGHVQQLFKAIGASNRTNAVYLAEQAKLL